jgi:hypothetical protein
MKKSILGILGLAAVMFYSCEDDPSNMGRIQQMRDTVLHSFSNISGTTIEVKDNERLNVILIGPSLPSAPEAEKQQMSGKVKDMAGVVFKGSNVTKGKVVFSNQDPTDMDAAMNVPGYDISFGKE